MKKTSEIRTTPKTEMTLKKERLQTKNPSRQLNEDKHNNAKDPKNGDKLKNKQRPKITISKVKTD